MDIGSLVGWYILGAMFNIALYGTTFLQCVIYFAKYQGDRWPFKAFVAFLFLADTVDTAFVIATVYDFLVLHFGELSHLKVATWLACTHPALTGIVSCSVQLYFAHRVKRLSGYTCPQIIIAVLALASLCGALGSAIAPHGRPEFLQLQQFKGFILVWLVCAVVADVIITVVLVRELKNMRTTFSGTERVINRIISVTLHTGLLIFIVALLDCVFYIASTSDTHFFFNMMLAKLYTNTLLSTLNIRDWLGKPQGLPSTGPAVHISTAEPNVVLIKTEVITKADDGTLYPHGTSESSRTRAASLCRHVGELVAGCTRSSDLASGASYECVTHPPRCFPAGLV